VAVADSDPRAYLGVGCSFPVKPVNGRLVYARYEDAVEQAIPLILLTARKERLMLPEFGAGARSFVFEPNSPATQRSIEDAVRKALTDWEPRIDLKRVEAIASNDTPDLLLVHIDYVVRATNTFYNRVYPFYLLEAGA
jgi:phage baseplate assembly protein W